MATFKVAKARPSKLGGGASYCLSRTVRATYCINWKTLVTQGFSVQTQHSLGTLLATLQEGQTPSNRGLETLTLSAAVLLPWSSCFQERVPVLALSHLHVMFS